MLIDADSLYGFVLVFKDSVVLWKYQQKRMYQSLRVCIFYTWKFCVVMDSNEQFIFEEILYSPCREYEKGYDGAWEMCKAFCDRKNIR